MAWLCLASAEKVIVRWYSFMSLLPAEGRRGTGGTLGARRGRGGRWDTAIPANPFPPRPDDPNTAILGPLRAIMIADPCGIKCKGQ